MFPAYSRFFFRNSPYLKVLSGSILSNVNFFWLSSTGNPPIEDRTGKPRITFRERETLDKNDESIKANEIAIINIYDTGLCR